MFNGYAADEFPVARANASELLAEPPTIEQIDVLAAKLPH